MAREPEEIYKIVGKRIREFRIKLGISQEKLAELTELSVAFIGQIERGHNRASLVTIQKIADILRVKISLLFNHIPTNTKQKYPLSKKIELLLNNSSQETKHELEQMIKLFLKRIPLK